MNSKGMSLSELGMSLYEFKRDPYYRDEFIYEFKRDSYEF